MKLGPVLSRDASEKRKGRPICTYTGVTFWPMDPRVEEVDIEDIAHSLSMLCRFNGHIKSFYSVAQHSVLVSALCSPENQLWGLLHDASEAYISDMPSPIKLELPDFIAAEKVVQKVVCDKFGLPYNEPAEVKSADLIVRATEMRDLRKNKRVTEYQHNPLKEKIKPWTQDFAKQAFLNAFEALTIKKL